jgi:hypothetical protein
MLWPAQQLAAQAGSVQATMQHGQPAQQQCLQHQHIRLLQQQQARSMSVVVDVQGNNVEKASRLLNKHFKDSGMADELLSRKYRKTSAELKFDQKKIAHNKRVGVLIAQRLRWVVRRRKLKM